MSNVSIARPLNITIPTGQNFIIGAPIKDVQFGNFDIVQDTDDSPLYMVQVDDGSGKFPYPWTLLFVEKEFIFVNGNQNIYTIVEVINDKLIMVSTNSTQYITTQGDTGFKVVPHYRYCSISTGSDNNQYMDRRLLPTNTTLTFQNEMLLAPFFIQINNNSILILGT